MALPFYLSSFVFFTNETTMYVIFRRGVATDSGEVDSQWEGSNPRLSG